MEHDRYPLVSIGVPVFNGETGLARCLECLLGQDHPNLEIIISDNASTDATPAIAERYTRLDPRVRYCRSDRNRGSAWNFSRVFELSSGKYFMWAAHDDERESGFVSTCVAELERHPDAVLCQVRTAVSIESSDDPLYFVHLDSFEGKAGIVERYWETLKRFPPTALYGLYRSSAVRKTWLWRNVIATDMAFAQELSIHGRFVQVPCVLFRYRARSVWNTIDQDARVFLGVNGRPWWYVPFVMLFIEHSSRLLHAPVSATVKVRLWGVLALNEVHQIGLKTVLKAVGALCPERQKERVGRAVYWRWMRNPNVDVVDADLFFRRVCKPQLGWWR